VWLGLSETKSGASFAAQSRISLALNPGYARFRSSAKVGTALFADRFIAGPCSGSPEAQSFPSQRRPSRSGL
jgi:hypothetical protein